MKDDLENETTDTAQDQHMKCTLTTKSTIAGLGSSYGKFGATSMVTGSATTIIGNGSGVK